MVKKLESLMIVGDPDIASFVSSNGVDRLFVDLEYIGKEERQPGHQSWKSSHDLDSLAKVRESSPNAHLLVRSNPVHEKTVLEVKEIIARGANSIMLPMFRTCDELSRFFDIVADRLQIVPLIETVGALESIVEIIDRLPIEKVHFGLNDLHLEMGYEFMFQVLSEGKLEKSCSILRKAEVEFGIGGIARAREGIVSPDYLLGEHVRLGSSAAILSRTFHRNAKTVDEIRTQMDFQGELSLLNEIYSKFLIMDSAGLEQNRKQTADRINDVVRLMSK